MTTISTERICPHCANSRSNMRKARFQRGILICNQCKREVDINQLRLKSELITPTHWGARIPIVNKDSMVYHAPDPGCVFDHIKQRMVDRETRKAKKRQALKVFKRG
jgi:hypothetical protein